MAQVVSVDPRSLVREAGLQVHVPITAKAVIEDGIVLATFGLAWSGGRCWLFFNVHNYQPGHGLLMRRECRRILRQAAQLGETDVFISRDIEYETSERLLKALGFQFYAHEGEFEVWHVGT